MIYTFLRKTCLFAVVLFLIINSGSSFAHSVNLLSETDTQKKELRTQLIDLFGSEGSFQWLVNGSQGPAGAPKARPLYADKSPFVIDQQTYINFKNQNGGAVRLAPDNTNELISIENNGYLRCITENHQDFMSVVSGIDAAQFIDESIGLSPFYQKTAINNGIIYVDASAESQGEAETEAYSVGMKSGSGYDGVVGNELALNSTCLNTNLIYSKSSSNDFAWSIGTMAQNYLTASGPGSIESIIALENSGNIFGEARGKEALVDGMYGLTEILSSGQADVIAQSFMKNTGIIYSDAHGHESLKDSWTTGMASQFFVASENGGNAFTISSAINSGTIFAEETGGDASAHGIFSEFETDATGKKNMSEQEEISGGGSALAIMTVENKENIYAAAQGKTATASAITSRMDMAASDDGGIVAGNMILNQGLLNAMAVGEDAAYSRGINGTIQTDLIGNGEIRTIRSIINEGDIKSSAEGGKEGMSAAMILNIFNDAEISGQTEIVNNGLIESRAQGDFSVAYGIQSSCQGPGNSNVNVLNTGTIHATASGNESFAGGIIIFNTQDGEIEIINQGIIHCLARADSANVFGIHATTAKGEINNTGTIVAVGKQAGAISVGENTDISVSNTGFIHTLGGARTLDVGYQQAPSPSRVTLKDNFRVVFSGNPETGDYYAPFLVNSLGTIDLNKSRLIVSADDDIAWNTEYKIIETKGGLIESEFQQLTADIANPSVKVAWAGTGYGQDAAVSFDFSPEQSLMPAAAFATRQAAEAGFGLIRNRMSAYAAFSILAADKSKVLQKPSKQHHSVFVRPYLNTVDYPRKNNLGYETATVGFMAGYEKAISKSMIVGLHGGAGKMNLDFTGYGHENSSEKTDLFSMGAHGIYQKGNWHLKVSSSFYTARHDYKGKTGMNLDLAEKDKYTSLGTESALTAGYGIRLGKMAFIPEAGISHSWVRGQSHSTDTGLKQWNTRYGSYDEHVFKSILGAKLAGNFDLGEMTVTPAIGIRWEESLGSNEISVSRSMAGAGETKHSHDPDDTAVLSEISLLLSRQNASLEVSFIHEKNNDYTGKGGAVKFRYLF
jgi:hypothetical protein